MQVTRDQVTRDELKTILKEVLIELFQDDEAMYELITAIQHEIIDLKSELKDELYQQLQELRNRTPFG